jgi:hypothetical protein
MTFFVNARPTSLLKHIYRFRAEKKILAFNFKQNLGYAVDTDFSSQWISSWYKDPQKQCQDCLKQ